MLLRVLLEGVGTCARTIGPRFATTGRLLRTVLLPTLERLGARAGCKSTLIAIRKLLDQHPIPEAHGMTLEA